MKLTDLLDLSGDELDRLYEDARTPDVSALRGDFRGVIIQGQVPGTRFRLPLGWANGRLLPWKGKAFGSPGSSGGHGYNRLVIGRRPRRIWEFDTRIAPSRFDGTEVCVIDYDVDGNGRVIRRAMIDEVKQLDGGLMLGKGGIRIGGKDRFTFYWAIAPAE